MSAKESEAAKGTKKKQRSPGYPIVPIDDAITMLRQVYKHDKRAFTTSGAILEHLGYSTKSKQGRSGTGGRMVSALRPDGLLDEKDDKYRISDIGFRILELPEDSEERAELIRESALKPPIFRKLLAYYKGEVPSDTALRSHLVLNEGFNPDYVDQFIRVFRAIIKVVNPSPEDYNAGEESEGAEQPTGATPMPQDRMYPGQPDQTRGLVSKHGGLGQGAMPPGMPFPLYLPQGRQGTLIIPHSMTKQDLKLLRIQIENHLAVAEATALVDDEPTRADLMKSRGTGERGLEPHSLLDEGIDEGRID